MSKLNFTRQEHYILLQTINCLDIEVDKSEFKSNAVFTKEFIVNQRESLYSKMIKLEEQLEASNSNQLIFNK